MTSSRTGRALVTGGTSAIGNAIVRELAVRDYELTFTYRSDPDAARALAEELGTSCLQLDLAGLFALPNLEVDVLVNNAGISLSGRELAETPDEDLKISMAVNFFGPVRLMRHFSAGMRTRGFGRIVNINSLYGLTSPPRSLGYAASKHALRAATRSLAQELAPWGITVNDVCPGLVDSPMVRSRAEVAVARGMVASVSDYLGSFVDRIPAGRMTEPEEVARAVGFLVSPEASACTGLALRVDGGLLDI